MEDAKSSAGYTDLESGAAGGANKYVVEALGTFFVSLVVFFSQGSAFVAAAMIALWVWLGSGHYNPSITLAFLIKDKTPPKDAAFRILSQIGGAFAGAAVSDLVSGSAYLNASGHYVAWGAIVTEVLVGLEFALAYLATSDGLTLGMAYFSGVSGLACFAKCGGLLRHEGTAYFSNPAVMIGAYLYGMLHGHFGLSIVVVTRMVAPLIGAALAPLFRSKVLDRGELVREVSTLPCPSPCHPLPVPSLYLPCTFPVGEHFALRAPVPPSPLPAPAHAHHTLTPPPAPVSADCRHLLLLRLDHRPL